MTDAGPRSKVARLIETYDLSGLGEELEARWTRGDDRQSLRQLAALFNRRLLRSALQSAGANPDGQEVETAYRQLTDDDVSSGHRTEARGRLRRQGVDVDRLTDDFVSRQAIHTYLTSYRDAAPPDDDLSEAEHRSRKSETIQRLTSRLVAVARRALTDLRNADRLVLGEFDVLVSVRVHCTDCGTQSSITDLLAAGGCECEDGDD